MPKKKIWNLLLSFINLKKGGKDPSPTTTQKEDLDFTTIHDSGFELRCYNYYYFF